jgi:hypothetical protein
MPLQCTMRPSGMEVITRSLAPKQPEAPRHAVASGFPSWSKKSRSFSNRERDPEALASWRSVAGLHEPNWDRLCGSLDWNESNPGELLQRCKKSSLEQTPSPSLLQKHRLTSCRDRRRTCRDRCGDPRRKSLASCRRGIAENCPHHLRCRPTSQTRMSYPERELTW